MSTTDNDGETPSQREPEERPSQRLHGLYRADLRPFEPVSDAQLLGAISAPKSTTSTITPRVQTSQRTWASHTTRGRRGGCGHNSTRSGPPGASAMFAAMD